MQEEAGQDVIEYALLAAGIAVVLIPTIPLLGAALKTKYEAITTKVSGIAVP
jgi:Flp pilus assembly pilin Flp